MTVSAESPAQPRETTGDLTSYGLFGKSPAMKAVLELVLQVAPSRDGVLICGERGTGREMIARAIHAHGPTPRGAFVAVDCAAPPPQELERQLFGVVPAPGRAVERRATERIAADGRLATARGGTLFLENVTAMPARVQLRLARLLRDREVGLEGRHRRIDWETRPIAAVDPSIDAAVSDGRVRADLFERLSPFRIDLPPLRERREDIPVLAVHFLQQLCAARDLPRRSFTRAALTLLAALPWRANTRELRNLLERLLLLVPHEVIQLEDILAHVSLDGAGQTASASGTLRDARLQFEREYIAAVLRQHKGRMGEAARVLGIQRTNLYRKVRQLRISPADGRHSRTR